MCQALLDKECTGLLQHRDFENECCQRRACQRIEEQQQIQDQRLQLTLLQAQKQQYIEFMAEWREAMTEPSPINPSQTHTLHADNQPLPQVAWEAPQDETHHSGNHISDSSQRQKALKLRQAANNLAENFKILDNLDNGQTPSISTIR